ncbi:hypothetical protein BH09CHL1_BH09CHL1_28570 [soil metagenome]
MARGQFRLFDFVEQTIERVVEGSVGRVLPSKLQPAEIARRIEREMTVQQIVSVDGPIAPNAFHVYVHPDDAGPLLGMRERLIADLETWLESNAAERGLRFVGTISVEIGTDERVARRAMRVTAAMIEDEPTPSSSSAQSETNVAYRLDVWLRNGDRKTVQLRNGFTIVGRAPAADLVLDDPSVSRYHARVEVQGRRVDVRDLDSTNGTRVNGREVSSAPLEAGDTIAFGSVEARISLRSSTDWS